MENTEPGGLEDAVKVALNNEPRAQELRIMRELLERRLAGLRRRLGEVDASERRKVEREMSALTKQVAILREEELVAEFVEQSVKCAWRANELGNP